MHYKLLLSAVMGFATAFASYGATPQTELTGTETAGSMQTSASRTKKSSSREVVKKEVRDTVRVISNPKSVVVIKEVDGERVKHLVTVKGNGCDTTKVYRYTYSMDMGDGDDVEMDMLTQVESKGVEISKKSDDANKKSWRLRSGVYISPYWGAIINTGSTELWKSANRWGLENLVQSSLATPSRNTKLSLGFGIAVDIYNINRGLVPSLDKHNNLHFTEAPIQYQDMRTRLNNMFLDLSFTLSHRFCSDCFASVGVAGLYNVYTNTELSYKNGHTQTLNMMTGLNQNPFQMELRGKLVFFDSIGGFVHWSPQTLFNGVAGPKFNTIVVGVELVEF